MNTPRRRYITVRGKGNFPFIMLSRDECFPADATEAGKMYDACPTVAPELTITLATYKQAPPSGTLWRDLKWPIQLIE